MDKKLDVKQVNKDNQGNINNIETNDGENYSVDEAINMISNEVEQVNIEGNQSKNNFINLVKKGETFGVVVDDEIEDKAWHD